MLSRATATAPRTSSWRGSPANCQQRRGSTGGPPATTSPQDRDPSTTGVAPASTPRPARLRRAPGRTGDRRPPPGSGPRPAHQARTARSRPGGLGRGCGRRGTEAVLRRGRRRRSRWPPWRPRLRRRCRPAARPAGASVSRGAARPRRGRCRGRAGGRRPAELLEDDGHLGERCARAPVLVGHLEPGPPGLRQLVPVGDDRLAAGHQRAGGRQETCGRPPAARRGTR